MSPLHHRPLKTDLNHVDTNGCFKSSAHHTRIHVTLRNRLFSLYYYFAITLAFLTNASFLKAADASSDWDYVLQNYETERNRISTGIVTLDGTGGFVDDSGNPQNTKRVGFIDMLSTNIFIAFTKDHLHYEREISDIKNTKPETGSMRTYNIVTPAIAYGWSNEGNAIFIINPKDMDNRRIHFIDVKSLGLYTKATYATCNSLDDNLKIMKKLTANVKNVEKSSAGLWAFTLEAPADPTKATMARQVITFDVKNGFTPISTKIDFISTSIIGPPSKTLETHTTKWEKRDDVFLPVEFTLAYPRANSTYKNIVKLTWKSVNNAVDPSFFKPESIPAPSKVGVVDVRNEQNNVLRPIALDEESFEPGKASWFSKLNLAGIALLGISLFCLIYLFKGKNSIQNT